MFVPQEAIKDKLFQKALKPNTFNEIEIATVMKINYDSDTVDILTDRGNQLVEVPVLSNKTMDDIFINGNSNNNKNFGAASIDLPVRNSRVLVVFIYGKIIYPVIIGCIPEKLKHKITTSSPEVRDRGRRFYLHQSHYYDKIDANGNYEQYLPDGTQISISDEVTDVESELPDKGKYEPLDENNDKPEDVPSKHKTVRIKHSSGTVVMINADGSVLIDAANNTIELEGSNIKLGKDATKNLALADHTHSISSILSSPSGPVTGTITAASSDSNTTKTKAE